MLTRQQQPTVANRPRTVRAISARQAQARITICPGVAKGYEMKVLLAPDGSKYAAEAERLVGSLDWPAGSLIEVVRVDQR